MSAFAGLVGAFAGLRLAACSGAFAGLSGLVSGLGLWVGDLVGLWALFLACRLWALLPGLCWALVGACDFVGAWAFAVLVGACKRPHGRMRALLGGCGECLWALVGAGAFLMKCCAAGCERIQALGRSASLMGACERT